MIKLGTISVIFITIHDMSDVIRNNTVKFLQPCAMFMLLKHISNI